MLATLLLALLASAAEPARPGEDTVARPGARSATLEHDLLEIIAERHRQELEAIQDPESRFKLQSDPLWSISEEGRLSSRRRPSFPASPGRSRSIPRPMPTMPASIG